jgi:hypothetical protein
LKIGFVVKPLKVYVLQPATVVHLYNPSTWNAEAEGSQVLGQSVLHSETPPRRKKKEEEKQLTSLIS